MQIPDCLNKTGGSQFEIFISYFIVLTIDYLVAIFKRHLIYSISYADVNYIDAAIDRILYDSNLRLQEKRHCQKMRYIGMLCCAYFLFFSCLICEGLWAQSPVYKNYTVNDGLPSQVVYCALQDHQGYMWFGTDAG